VGREVDQELLQSSKEKTSNPTTTTKNEHKFEREVPERGYPHGQ